jgi:TPR repeat protein
MRQAWQQGHADAQTGLGGLYYKGKGVPKDVARGVALFKQAVAGGSQAAADLLRTLGEAVRGAPSAGAPQPMD